MGVLDDKTDTQLGQSIVAELAKAQNEISCAKRDLEKASNRITFSLALQNSMMNRKKDEQK
jgi:predicted dinucleotide-binding enzyme